MCIYSSTTKIQARGAHQLGRVKPNRNCTLLKSAANDMTVNTHLLGKSRRNRKMMSFQPDYPCSKKPTKTLVLLSLYPLLLPLGYYVKTTQVSFAVYIGYYFSSSSNSMYWTHQQKLQLSASASWRTAVSSLPYIILLLFFQVVQSLHSIQFWGKWAEQQWIFSEGF